MNATKTAKSKTAGSWGGAIRPYLEKAPLAAFFLGISSGYPFAMIAATLTTRLKQSGIDKATITAFSLAFLVYNAKPLWSWIIDGVRLPLLGRMGQRVSWMVVICLLVIAAVVNLALVDPASNLNATVVAALLLAFAGASYDIVIDAYRIEILEPYQLGVGSGMTQYGWRIGAAGSGALALMIAGMANWHIAYLICAVFALPAMLAALVVGEPTRHHQIARRAGLGAALLAIWGPFADFFRRRGAWLVLAFILLHKIGDTLANLTLRLLFDDLHYTNNEIAFFDIGVGFWTFLAGIFIGGILYARMGLKRSVLLSLVLMGVSNLSFALLAMSGHNDWALGGAVGFENFSSGIGSVTVVAYFSALCDLRFTASQYALISAAASVVGRFITGTTAGRLIELFGYVDFYLLTTVAALPGILLFWWMSRAGLIDASMGDAGRAV